MLRHPRRFFNPFRPTDLVSRLNKLGIERRQGEIVKLHKAAVVRISVGIVGGLVLTGVLTQAAHATTNNLPAVVVETLADVIVIPDVPPIAPAGPVVFPLNFTVGTPVADIGLTASRLVVPAPADGCTRVVNSMTTGFTVQAEAPVQIQFSILGSGPPIELVPGTTSTYVGDGVVLPIDPLAGLVLIGLQAELTPQSGVATIAFENPRDYLDVVGGFGVVRGVDVEDPPSNWTLTNATYDVTDTCPDLVVAAPAALAETGASPFSIGLVASAILAVGVLLGVASRRRRENTH
jgi:hypothetical protein